MRYKQNSYKCYNLTTIWHQIPRLRYHQKLWCLFPSYKVVQRKKCVEKSKYKQSPKISIFKPILKASKTLSYNAKVILWHSCNVRSVNPLQRAEFQFNKGKDFVFSSEKTSFGVACSVWKLWGIVNASNISRKICANLPRFYQHWKWDFANIDETFWDLKWKLWRRVAGILTGRSRRIFPWNYHRVIFKWKGLEYHCWQSDQIDWVKLTCRDLCFCHGSLEEEDLLHSAPPRTADHQHYCHYCQHFDQRLFFVK